MKVIPASVEPFVLTYTTDPNKIEEAFLRWLDHCLAIAFKEWGDRI